MKSFGVVVLHNDAIDVERYDSSCGIYGCHALTGSEICVVIQIYLCLENSRIVFMFQLNFVCTNTFLTMLKFCLVLFCTIHRRYDFGNPPFEMHEIFFACPSDRWRIVMSDSSTMIFAVAIIATSKSRNVVICSKSLSRVIMQVQYPWWDGSTF